MAIETVHLKNFSLFSDLTLKAVPGVNVIIGENGTGKTHILKAIYMGSLQYSTFDIAELTKFFPMKEGTELLGKNQKDVALVEISTSKDDKKKKMAAKLVKVNMAGSNRPNISCTYEIVLPCSISQAVYIPVKDMLTHSKGILEMAEKYRGFPFDKTLLDIVRIAKRLPLKQPPELAQTILPKLEAMIDGTVDYEDDEFFVRKHDGRKVNFSIEAEGFKKIGLLWQLLMNESITPGSVLLWDEPDANLNPKFLPTLVDCLLELSRHGVQIFLGTHSYLLAKYFDVKKSKEDSLKFCSLFFESGNINCEVGETFIDLKHNAILKTFDDLVEVVYGSQM